jgi:hypothetical protein
MLLRKRNTDNLDVAIPLLPRDQDSNFELVEAGNNLDDLLTRSWWAMVNQYSSRFLTKEKDKLAAFAGIAHKVSEIAKSQDVHVNYLSGLWSGRYLIMGLLWYVSMNRTERLKKIPDDGGGFFL